MPKMYLRLPSHKCKDSSPCNLYWFSDGTQIDLNADARCGTCQNFAIKSGRVGRCAALMVDVSSDFGCKVWKERIPAYTGPAKCQKCGGTGTILLENWHAADPHPCPECAK